MMVLLFKVDNDCYGMDVASVVELVPYMVLQKLPKAPEFIAGLLNYRGSIVPVVDLTMLLVNRPTRQLLSSRIILTRPTISGGARFVGLLAEQVTEASKIPDDEFSDTGLKGDQSIFVDKLAVRPEGLVQHINVDLLLPTEVKEMLRVYPADGEAVLSE